MSSRVLEGSQLKYSTEERTLGSFFFAHADKYTDRVCQIDGTINESQTYGFVKTKSVRLAISMQNREITPSSVIAVCSANSLENTIPLLAAFYLGAKVISFEPTSSLEYLKHLLELITPRMIFVEGSSAGLIEKSLRDANFQNEIVVIGYSKKNSIFANFIQSKKNEQKFKPAKVDPDEVALMVFTSGVDGRPKIVCHSHRTFLCLVLRAYEVGIRYSALHVNNFYWLSAYVIMACCFKEGNYRVFTHSPTAETILKMVEMYTIPFLFLAPHIVHHLANYATISNFDTSFVKVLMCTGAPMAPSLFKQMHKLFPKAIISLVFATAETGIAAAFDLKADNAKIKTRLASSGKPAALVKLKIVDLETQEQLGPNQPGEICLKTSSMMVGYYKSDSSFIFDEQGFFKTGDLGSYDEEECIYVFDKVKNVFTYENACIIPAIIEAVLLEHPAIKEAAVFGLPFDGEGEVPAACVVLKDGCALNREEIDLFLKPRVAKKERLRGGITFLSNLPRTPTAKVLKEEIRDLVIKSKGG